MIYKHSCHLIFYPFLLIVSLIVFSCGSENNDKPKTEKISIDSLTRGPVVHDTLSAAQIGKIKKIQMTFADVNTSTLAETMDNFKRDQHPDTEIDIWLSMAIASKSKAQLRLLDNKEVSEIFSYYTKEATPITIEKR